MAKARRLLIGLAVAAGIAAAGGGWALVEARARAVLDAPHPLPPSALRAATAPDAIARGAHLTAVTACGLCHGEGLAGRAISIAGSTVAAPNLTVLAGRRSDADLDRAIRRGLRPDGRAELAMPSQAYAGFTDDEVGAVIGYLRSLPPHGAVSPRPAPGLMLRANLADGLFKTAAQRVAEARPPPDAGPRVAAGHHLAAVACGQCHGADLAGGRGFPGPDLTVRGYYDRAAFHTLMRTGVGVDDSDMELMARAARASFSHFSDGEIDAIYDYLDARDRLLGAAESRH